MQLFIAMEDYYICVYLGVISINSILALWKWRTVEDRYKPFLWLMLISMVTTWCQVYFYDLSRFLNLGIENPLVNRYFLHTTSNAFVLIEGILFTLFFQQTGYLSRRPWLAYAVIGALLLFWLIEGLYFDIWFDVLLRYRVFYSFVLTLLGIHAMNFEIVHYKGNLLKNASFLICVSVVFYFTYNVVLESFYIAGLKTPSFDLKRLVRILTAMIFTFSLLWMPRKI